MPTTTPVHTVQVLLVEHSPDMQWLLDVMLRDEGYAVMHVTDGVAALDVLRSSPQSMVVILNTTAPRDGLRVVHQAAEREPAVARHALVLVTAVADMLPPEWQQLVETQGMPVVPKPFDVLTLLDAVATAAARLPDPPARDGQSAAS